MDRLDHLLAESAAEDQLTWDQSKNLRITFVRGRKQSCNTLGIRIRSNLSFGEHIRRRTAKATSVLKTMTRLGSNNGGMSLNAMRALYTGAYHGTSYDELLAISHIEPLGIKLDDISVSWAARSLRTGDPQWQDGSISVPPTQSLEVPVHLSVVSWSCACGGT